MEIEWGLFHDHHVPLSTHLPKEGCHLLFAPNLGCVSTNAWKLFPLGEEASVFLGTRPSVAAHCTCCLVPGGVVVTSLPLCFVALSVFICVSFVSLLLREWEPGCACLCLLPPEGKDPTATSFLHPVSSSPVCHSINLDKNLPLGRVHLAPQNVRLSVNGVFVDMIS